YATSHGVRIAWEEHGQGERAVLLVPPWQIVGSGVWKMQVPYFSRHFRVLTLDAPGSGRSERPASGYDPERMADHALAVLDAARVDRASLVCLSRGARAGALLAVERPERVERLVLTAPGLDDRSAGPRFFEPRERYEGWGKYNAHYLRAHYRDFVEF